MSERSPSSKIWGFCNCSSQCLLSFYSPKPQRTWAHLPFCNHRHQAASLSCISDVLLQLGLSVLTAHKAPWLSFHSLFPEQYFLLLLRPMGCDQAHPIDANSVDRGRAWESQRATDKEVCPCLGPSPPHYSQLSQVNNKQLLTSCLFLGISQIPFSYPTIAWGAQTYNYRDKVDTWWYSWFLGDPVDLKGHLSFIE